MTVALHFHSHFVSLESPLEDFLIYWCFVVRFYSGICDGSTVTDLTLTADLPVAEMLPFFCKSSVFPCQSL